MTGFESKSRQRPRNRLSRSPFCPSISISMYFPILTLRTSGMQRCRMASRTALPWGSSTAAFGMTMTFAFTSSPYLPASREQAQSKTGLLQNYDVQRSFAAKHVDSDVPFVVSGKQKIGAPVCYLQSADRHLLEKPR